jgi:hypothetical protein
VPLVVLLAAGGFGLWRWLAPGEAPPALEQPPVAHPEPAAAPSTAVAAAPEPPATAEEAPALLGRASQHPLVAKGLALPGLLRRWAVVTENLSQGDSPRKELAFLAPAGRFSVVPRGDGVVASPAAWARYDGFAAAVDSVDVPAAASAYRRLHGVLDTAFAALGYKPGALDAATARALRRLADAPAVTDETRLVQAEGVFVYADPKLEQLPDVEKHLLRMGPANERKIQAKARALLAELNLPVVAAKR